MNVCSDEPDSQREPGSRVSHSALRRNQPHECADDLSKARLDCRLERLQPPERLGRFDACQHLTCRAQRRLITRLTIPPTTVSAFGQVERNAGSKPAPADPRAPHFAPEAPADRAEANEPARARQHK